MAWTTPKTWASGYVVLAADLNTHLRDNLNVTAPAVMTTQGDVIYASGANTPARLAKDANPTRSLTNTGSSNNPAWDQVALATGVSGTLPHENGGLEFDASAVTTGDIIVGQSAGVMGLETAMSQAQAEAGTDTQVRGVTAQRMKQAVDALGAGVVKQVVSTQDAAVATTTTTMPMDDTIPQNTEGAEFMTLAITPKNTSNRLIITTTVVGGASATADSGNCIALFQDATAGALAGAFTYENPARTQTVSFTHIMSAGTTSSTTFKIRAGPHTSGTYTFNGRASARIFGGVIASSIVIVEVEP